MSESARKILLATDGSREAERAAGMARELSGALDAELHVLYVESVPEAYIHQWEMAGPEFIDEIFESTGREARKKAEEEAAKIGAVAGVHAAVGRADAEIVRLAEELGAEMVVLGSRGLGAVRRALMGSVSVSVVRHAHTSALVVRGEPNGETYFPGRILLATDGSKEAEAASRTAAEISVATDSPLHLLYALDLTPRPPYPHPLAGERWEHYLEEAKEKAREFVEERADRLRAAGAEVAVAKVAFGRPDAEIVEEAEELGASLVVTGSRGLGGIRRSLMGSVSDSVVRHAHCPVLVVRRKEEKDR
ncbi:Universal stress protein [Rubrobacter xylanophilus DSM 9941]|uniref:universal stress protein n=1 Tax=Rubrobacter xylanophilus TaxID=49319 RepID=UPI001F3D3A29|nr:universal stress protein [Rubrobacter xylanophilus]QYJ15454.1 Universal stress protein [Rubrobacter xylanophilus DSM 9941]